MLTLEHLAEGSDDCPLIRLFGFETADILAFQRTCIELAEGRIPEFRLHEQPWVRAIDGWRFVWRAAGGRVA